MLATTSFLELIVGTFLASARRQDLCPELRVILPPSVFGEVRAAEVLRSLREAPVRSAEAAEAAEAAERKAEREGVP